MACGFSSSEEFYQCIVIAKTWFNIGMDLVGLGTFALIALLHWLFKRLRKELRAWEERVSQTQTALEQAREEKRLAEGRALNAERHAAAVEKEPERLRGEIEALKEILTTKSDELHAKAAELTCTLSNTQARIAGALAATAYDGVSDDIAGFWSRPAEISTSYTKNIANSIPILLFGNQKGGVAKTMTVANLAACFAEQGERVLVVDLDYQGSLSNLMRLQDVKERGAAVPVDVRHSRVDHLFEAELHADWWAT